MQNFQAMVSTRRSGNTNDEEPSNNPVDNKSKGRSKRGLSQRSPEKTPPQDSKSASESKLGRESKRQKVVV